jgi:hypothetical protein
MAETSNPTIPGTTITFSGGVTGAPYVNSDLVDWVDHTGLLTYYGTTRTVGDANPILRRWAGTAQPSSADYGIYQRMENPYSTSPVEFWLRASLSVETGYRGRVADDGTWSIAKVVAGAATVLNNGDLGSLANNTQHTFELYAEGSSPTTLKLYVNGVQIGGDVVDSTSPITAQGYAIYGWNDTNNWRSWELGLRTEGAVVLGMNDLPSGETIPVGGTPNLDLTAYPYGGTTPYTYTVESGTLPTGLSLATDGSWTGTVTADSGLSDVTFRVTDDASDFVVSTTYTFNTTAQTNDPPSWTGTIPNFSLIEGQARASFDLSSIVEDQGDTFVLSEGQTWPAGVAVVGTNIVFTHANFVEGSYNTLTVLADDSHNAAVASNTFNITIAAAPSNTATVTSPVLSNGAGSVVASELVSWIWFPGTIEDSTDNADMVKGTATTNTSGVFTTGATCPPGAGHLFYHNADYSKVGFKPLTAV